VFAKSRIPLIGLLNLVIKIISSLYPSTTSNLPSTPLFTFDHSFMHIQEIINLELQSSLSYLFWDFSNHNLNFMFHLINGVEEKG
jgi:hypothetical protein